MSNNLEALKFFFESGTAEGDSSFLSEVFVPFEEYIQAITMPSSGPRLILGNKGSGKSAALRFFKSQLDTLNIPSLLLRPKDIELTPSSETALGPLTRASEAAVLKAIAGKLGSEKSGLIIRAEDKVLLGEALSQGLIEKDLISRMTELLSPIGKQFSGVDFSKINDVGHQHSISIRKAIESSINRSDSIFYILIDDTDQIASPSEPNHLNRIWAFLLASRSINEYCPNIKFIISIRDEVWRRLKRDGAGQRDQVDHFRNLAKRISMSEENLKEVITKRLVKAYEKLGKSPNIKPYELFFDTDHIRIPTADTEYRYWDDFIVTRSRERPRDSIQLIFKLCDKAMLSKQDKIQAVDVSNVMPIYSEERVDDLKRECDQECPQIKEVIRSFHNINFDGGAFSLHPQSTADFLNSLPSRFSVNLFSKPLTHSNSDDIFSLWRYLHEIGFLNARVSDSREKYGYRHITSEEDPELISPARWNEMQSILWEIHPAYRDYLIKVSKDKSFSFGLPKKESGRDKARKKR